MSRPEHFFANDASTPGLGVFSPGFSVPASLQVSLQTCLCTSQAGGIVAPLCIRLDQHAKMLDIERRRLALIDEAERQAPFFSAQCPASRFFVTSPEADSQIAA